MTCINTLTLSSSVALTWSTLLPTARFSKMVWAYVWLRKLGACTLRRTGMVTEVSAKLSGFAESCTRTRNYNTHAHSQLQHACTLATTTRMRSHNYNTHAHSQLQHAHALAPTTRMRSHNYNTHAHSQLQHACALATTTRMRSHNYNTHALSQLQHACTLATTTRTHGRRHYYF